MGGGKAWRVAGASPTPEAVESAFSPGSAAGPSWWASLIPLPLVPSLSPYPVAAAQVPLDPPSLQTTYRPRSGGPDPLQRFIPPGPETEGGRS